MKISTVIDTSKPFQFISIDDCGETCCPHCGADGRYIYNWAEFGVVKSAMAGCYKALTGRLDKDDVSNHIERIAFKQSRNKELNGWDKTVVRMMKYIKDNSADVGKVSWANDKILQAVASSKSYQFRKF